MEEAYQQNLAKLRLELELNQALEEIRMESRNEFLKLIDDYTLEMLMDYHSGMKEQSKSYDNAYSLLIGEWKFRSKNRK